MKRYWNFGTKQLRQEAEESGIEMDKRSQNEIRTELDLTKKLLESSGGFYLVTDENYNILYFSSSVKVLFNKPHDWFSDKKFIELIHPDEREKFISLVGEIGQKENIKWVHRYNCCKGERWFQTRLSANNEENKGFIIFSTEVTEILQKQIKSEKPNNSLLEISKTLPYVIISYSKDYTIKYASPNISRLLPVEAGEIIGESIDNLDFLSEKTMQLKILLSRIFENGNITDKDFSFETQNGPVQFSQRFIPEKSGDGSVHSVLGILWNRTEMDEIRMRQHTSEEKFRKIFETNPDSVVLSRLRDGKLLDVNQGFLNLTGYSYKEVIGKTTLELGLYRDKSDRDFFVDKVQKQAVINHPLLILNRDRDQIEVSMSANIFRLDSELHLISIFRDVSESTAQKKLVDESLEKLRSSEAKFRAFIDHSPDGFVITDEKGKVIDWNRSMERFTNISYEEAVGKESMQIYEMLRKYTSKTDISNEEIKGIFLKQLQSNSVNYEKINFRLNIDQGREKFELENLLFSFSSGKKRQLGVISRDITLQRKSEEATLLYKNIFENSLDGGAILDLKGNYLEMNQTHTQILGYSFEELAESGPGIFLGDKLHEEISKVYSFQGLFEGELLAKTKAGEDIFLDYMLFPVVSEGVKICTVEIIRNISQRKKTEKQLLEAKIRAEEADHLKTAFLSNMSHEIRTPMNSILGFSALLERQEISYQTRLKYLNFINKNGESLLNLIGDIIDIAKIESNQLTINKNVANLTEVLGKIKLSMLKVMEREGKTDVDLRTSFTEENVFIFTDIFRLEQVLVNLVYNAIKFTASGFIEFGYTFSKENELLFFVKDTGIGIPAELQDSIFKRFHKLENSRKKLYGGAGLGLTISSQLVALLGGRIWVESYVDEGSTFYFVLPFVKGSKMDDKTSEATMPLDLKWPGKTILIVEDDFYSYELLTEYLNESGLKILHAKNGKSAVSIFAENSDISLVLMDIQLPGINGLEATRLIREINADVPVIAQTAFAMENDKNQALEAGCIDFLAKPVQKDKFLKVIARYI